MRLDSEKGFTLVELLLAITIMGIIAAATMPILSAMRDAHTTASARSSLYHEALLIMDSITNGLRKTTVVAVPNNHNTTRDILAYSRLVNSDNDFYYGDPLFPRIDEDVDKTYTLSGDNGIQGLDDDGDGLVDEENWKDEDEDAITNEDWIDGLDNDGDGNVDEDLENDANSDGMSGIGGLDDDGDGQIDEEVTGDDDEDGTEYEEEILFAVYVYTPSTNTLTKILSDPVAGINSPAPQLVLSTQVTNFETRYKSPGLIQIKLELTGDDGKVVEFDEHVYVENVLQKIGKRVR